MSAPRPIVLMYHRIGPVADAEEARYAVTPKRFAEHMTALARAGYRGVPVDALVDWLDGGQALRGGDMVVTFDDGFLGVREHAGPVLESLRWPYTVFLVSDRIGQLDNWKRNQNVDGHRYALLDAADIQGMERKGASFHSHTRSHANLTELDDARLNEELAGSWTALAGLLERPPRYIAYPYGHHDPRVIAAARSAGYHAGFSVQPGFNMQSSDRFRLRRIDVFGTDSATALLRKTRLGCNDGSLENALRYYTGQLGARLRAAAA